VRLFLSIAHQDCCRNEKEKKKWLRPGTFCGKIKKKTGGIALEKEITERIAELFKAFGDPTRVQILSLLAQQERCVGDIAEGISLSQSAVSHQLRILKQMHLIKCHRDGKNVLYSLADDHVRTILQMGLEHVME
jgi:ArsR family transcriptional regulator